MIREATMQKKKRDKENKFLQSAENEICRKVRSHPTKLHSHILRIQLADKAAEFTEGAADM